MPVPELPPEPATKTRALLRWPLLEVLLLLFTLTSAWPQLSSSGAGIDYYQFWLVGQSRAMQPTSGIYSAEDRKALARLGREIQRTRGQGSPRLEASVQFRETVETFSTPFLYAVVGALSSGDYEADLTRFHVICLLVFLAAILALGKAFGYPIGSCALFAVLLYFWSTPLGSDIHVGNVNQLQLGATAAWLALRRGSMHPISDVLGGLVLGLLVTFKPNLVTLPLLLGCTWVADRRFRTLWIQGACAMLGAAIAIGIGAGFAGSLGAWTDWLAAIRELGRDSQITVVNGNYAIAQFLIEAGGPSISVPLTLGMLALAAFSIWRARVPLLAANSSAGQLHRDRESESVALACGITCTTLGLVWLHYWVLLIPVMMHSLRPWLAAAAQEDRPPPPLWVLGLGSCGFLLALAGPLHTLALGLGREEAPIWGVVGAWLLLGSVFLGSGRPSQAPNRSR